MGIVLTWQIHDVLKMSLAQRLLQKHRTNLEPHALVVDPNGDSPTSKDGLSVEFSEKSLDWVEEASLLVLWADGLHDLRESNGGIHEEDLMIASIANHRDLWRKLGHDIGRHVRRGGHVWKWAFGQKWGERVQLRFDEFGGGVVSAISQKGRED